MHWRAVAIFGAARLEVVWKWKPRAKALLHLAILFATLSVTIEFHMEHSMSCLQTQNGSFYLYTVNIC